MASTPFTVRTFEPRIRPGAMPSLLGIDHGLPLTSRAGWFAEVESEGKVVQFSRLEGETEWTADAMWQGRGNSMPAFMHGFGSRCTIPMHAAVDVAAHLDSLVEQYEPDTDH